MQRLWKNLPYIFLRWELAGSGDPGETSQLLLVGMMIDRASIRMEEGYVIMELYKEF